jgi:hypothetical protein
MPRNRDVASALGSEETILREIDTRLASDELLSAADREQILERARKHVEDERKEAVTDELLQKAIKAERRKHNPKEAFEDVILDLPPYQAYIALDGVMYFHGLRYTVTYSVARVMDDIAGRGWEHQNEIDGRTRHGDLGRKHRNTVIGPNGSQRAPAERSAGAVNTRQSVLSSVNENTAL